MRSFIIVLFALVTLSGCSANLFSIDRKTDLPGKEGEGQGVAIHLDAKQRLAFAKSFGAVCAEPSPDALSAFASSFGGGLAVPQYGSAAVAQAMSEAAASIGLRTQSITLMRDALYRICEGYYNRALNQVMVMQLLGRSQDLTLAVLAIEQLTQPIVAQQAVLNTSASSSASAATLVANQQVLEAARKAETQANEQVTTAQSTAKASQKKVDDKRAELATVKAQDPYMPKLEALQKDLDAAEKALTAAEQALKDATAKRDTIQRKVAFLKEEIEIETKKDPNGPRLPALRASLAQGEKDLTAAEQAVTNATTKRDAAKTAVDDKGAEIEAVKGRDPDTPRIEALQKELDQAKKDLEGDQRAVKEAEAAAQTAKGTREALERNYTAAQAAAMTAATGSFGTPIVVKPPASDAAVRNVADAVTRIVEAVIKKDHKIEACLSLLSRRAQLRASLTVSTQQEAARELSEYSEALRICQVVLTGEAEALAASRK